METKLIFIDKAHQLTLKNKEEIEKLYTEQCKLESEINIFKSFISNLKDNKNKNIKLIFTDPYVDKTNSIYYVLKNEKDIAEKNRLIEEKKLLLKPINERIELLMKDNIEEFYKKYSADSFETI
jgi:hypothetical protein